MRLLLGKYRTRKAMKQCTSTMYHKSEGAVVEGTGNPMIKMVKSLRSTFGFSKHRGARQERFRARQKGGRK